MTKKLTALLLALVLVVSTIPTAYAGGELSTDAKACVTLGMLKGPTGTVDFAYTQSEPTRLQVAIMFLRLKGLENEALSYSGTSNFKDAGQIAWTSGRSIMAYLKDHPTLGWVGSNGYFNPEDLISAQAYYKVLLETLGYTQIVNGAGDFTWNDTLTFAATKGLRKLSSGTKFTVDDMAVATIQALRAKLKGSSKTLVEDLVEKGKLDKTAAAAAGLISAPIVFAVSNVEVSNFAEVKVVFTDKVDKLSAENVKNYSIEKHDIIGAMIQADGKSVILSLDTDGSSVTAAAFEDDEEFVLAINDINNTDKTQKVDSYKSKTLTAADTAVPVAEKAELVGPYKVKVTFSEPINTTTNANIVVNKGEYEAVVEDANGTRDVYVTLSDTLKEGSYSLTISGAKDFMGYSSPKNTLTLTYKKITSAPTVSVVSSNEKEVVVKFNRPVTNESENALDGSYFYHTNTYLHPEASTKDNQTYVLDFSNNPLPEGSVKLVVLYSVGGSAVTDEWGNEMKANATFTLNIVADKVKPQVTQVKVKDEQTLQLYFSESLNVDTVLDIDNYIVRTEKDEAVDISDIDYTVNASANEYIATLKFNDKLSGSYTLEISGIEDMAAEPNVIATKTFDFEVKDVAGIDLKAVTATTVEGTGTKPDYIYISFPEDMTIDGQYGILNEENYLLSNDAGDTFDPLTEDDTISLMTGERAIKITLKDNSTYEVDDDNFRISIGRLADKAGNKSALFAATINPSPDAPVEAVEFVIVDKATIEVTFNGIIKTAPTSGFRISKNGGTATAPSAVRLRYEDADNDGSNETIAALTLKSTQQMLNSDAEGVFELGIVANSVKSETSLYCEEDLNNAVSDGIAPNIIEIVQDYGTIVINFDEDITVTNAGLASTDLVIRDKNSKILLAGVDYKVQVDSSSLTVILTGTYDGYTGRVTVDTKDNVTYIFDNDGEHVKLKAFGTPKALTLE